jgi:hypothetical protein
MHAPETNRFDELISRYLDGELKEGERAELSQALAAPEMAERFLEITKLNAEIGGLLSAPVPDSVMVELVMSDLRKEPGNPGQPLRLRTNPAEPAPAITPVDFRTPATRGRKPSQFRTLKWAAVLVGLIAVASVCYVGFWRSSDTMKVARIEGEVQFMGTSGETRLQAHSPLRNGSVKTVGASSGATIVLNDGTSIDVGGNSILAIRTTKEPARFLLKSGSLKSQITKQPKNHPLIFATPEAEAIVVGTTLRLAVSGHSTRLEVMEGEARFRRLHDGAEVRVPAGHYAVAAPNAPFVATPHHPEPHHQPTNTTK